MSWRRRVGVTFLVLVLALVSFVGFVAWRGPLWLTSKVVGAFILSSFDGPIRYWWGDLIATAEVAGDVAYVGLAAELGVVDLTDERHPKLVKTLDMVGIAHGFMRRENLLFCADGIGGLAVFDISEPLDPEFLDRLVMPGYGLHVADLDEHHVILSAEVEGWFIVDVSDPSNMLPRTEVPGGWVEAVIVVDDIAYVLDGLVGVAVYDITDLDAPQLLTTVPIHLPPEIYEPDPPPLWMEIVGDYGYVANSSDGVRVLDLSDPAQAHEVGHLPLEGYTDGIAARGDRAYVSSLGLGLIVIDISDPEHPEKIATIPTPGTAHDVILRGDRAYLSDGASGLAIYDLVDPDRPEPVGYYYTRPSTRGVSLDGELLLTADAGDGVRVFDVADPRHPRLLATVDTPGYAHQSVIEGDTAYLADVLGGFARIDLSDPAHPRYDGPHLLEEHPWGVRFDGEHMLGAMGFHGASVFQWNADTAEALLNAYSTYGKQTGYTISIAHTQDWLIAGDAIFGLFLYDRSDPNLLRPAGHYIEDLTSPRQFLSAGYVVPIPGLAVEGDRVYAASYHRGVGIFDLAADDAPRLERRIELPGHTYGVWKDGDRLCAVSYEGELFDIDLSRAGEPEIRQRYRSAGPFWDVVCKGDVAYVAAGAEGLVVVDLNTGDIDRYPTPAH